MSQLPQPRQISPGGVLRDSTTIASEAITQPSWLAQGRRGAMFVAPAAAVPAVRYVSYFVRLGGGGSTAIVAPVEFRYADDVRGEIRREVAGAPMVTLTLGQRRRYVRADALVDMEIPVRLRSHDTATRVVRVALRLPPGLAVDSIPPAVTLGEYGAEHTLRVRVRGRLAPGLHRVAAVAESNGQRFDVGYDLLDYEHIRPQRIYRPAQLDVEAVRVSVPDHLRVAYIPGVSDNVAPALEQLGIPVTVVSPDDVGRTDLSEFTTVVLGPRAYEAHPALANVNAKLFDVARRGGTLVVQYGQYEMTRPGMMPYPITINRPHDRVTHEEAPVTILDENETLLRAPNRISQADFANWVQERSLYMPRSFDERYRPVIAISDPGETLNRGGILIAPLGRGTYVYTTLAFFRQLPAGVPGAARLFVNLLSAGLPSSTNP